MKYSKAVFTSAVLFLLLLLASCGASSKGNAYSPEQTFTVGMSAQKDGKNFEADIICDGYNDIKIMFTSPEELSGFTVTAGENGFNVNAFGIIDEISSAELNKASLLYILTETLRTAVFTNHGKFKESADGYSAELMISNTPVSVTFSEDGYITQMTAPTMDFSAVFKYAG